jgi:CHAT domain-containing protein
MATADQLAPIVNVIFDFLREKQLDKKKAFLEAHSELCTPDADVVMGWLIEDLRAKEQHAVAQLLVDARTLITVVRDGGLERTFAYLTRSQALLSGDPEILIEDEKRASRAWLRYISSDDRDALEEALAICEQVLARPDFAAAPSASRARVLDTTALTLLARFGTAGHIDDLDQAITISEQALALTPADTPDHARRLSYRGSLHRQRFEATGGLTDLKEAIKTFRQASRHAGGDPVATAEPLNNLGNSLCALYRLSESGDDLDAAIRAHEQAVATTLPNSPTRALSLSNLTASLCRRYDRSGNPEDLAKILRDAQLALDLTPPDSPERTSRLANLAGGLHRRFEAQHDPADLDKVIQHYRQAVDLAPPQAPSRAICLANLGESLWDRYGVCANPEDLRLATEAFRQACEVGLKASVGEALRAGRNWGRLAFEQADWLPAAEALTYAARAAERLFKKQLVRREKEAWLRPAQELPGLTAYALARCGRLPNAVEALEAGRARLLAEAQERDRHDLQQLADIGHADLYARYSAAVARLSLSMGAETNDRQQSSRPNRSADLRSVHAEMESAIQAIRKVPGYQDFLAAPTYEQIQQALTTPFSIGSGPAAAVQLLVTSAGALALILHAKGIEPLWLDVDERELNQVLVRRQEGKIAGGYLVDQFRPSGLKQTLKQLQPWLGTKLMGPIAKKLMELMPIDGASALRSVYLIPSGRLALLPLHAATYNIDGRTRTFLDDFAIAYAPSAKGLRYSRQALEALPSVPSDLFAVGNPLPLPEGLAPLAFAKLEVEEIGPLFGHRARLFCGTEATRAEVERHIRTARYVHLACHGHFNPIDPLASGLVLSQGEPLRLGELLAGPRFPAARLAALSACQTAITDFKDLPEEAIGLPAAFLQLGVPGVVGSLWSVDDLSTMLLVVKFYQYHLRGDPERQHGPLCPAHALRRAQLWLRGVTNEQLSRLFDEYRMTAPDRPGRLRMPYATAANHFSKYTLAERKRSPFESAFHWAAFAFHGL